MKYFAVVAIIASCAMISACRTTKSTQTEQVDSTRTIIKEIVVQQLDTIFVTLPAQTKQSVSTCRSDTLQLDNIISIASVDTSGLLWHSLEQLAKPLPIVVPRTIIVRDSTQAKVKRVTETKTIVQPLDPWSRFKIAAFWWLLSFALLGVVFLFCFARKIKSSCVKG